MLSCIVGRNVGFRSRPLIMRFKIVAVIRGKCFPFFAPVNAASFFDFRLFCLFSPSFPFARCNPVAFSVNIDNDDHTVTYTLTSLVFSPSVCAPSVLLWSDVPSYSQLAPHNTVGALT